MLGKQFREEIMGFHTLTLSHPRPALLLVTLARPQAANALNTQMAQELSACFGAIAGDIRAAILTGEGPGAFCAGADLKERLGMMPDQWETQHAALRAARDSLLYSPFPVIAAVNGAAYGGGLELALACDFIYAADHARFALSEATLGIMPGLGGTQLLPRAIGERRARELTLTGRPFSAQEALDWGMVNTLCPAEVLLDTALDTAEAIAASAPLSVRAIRRAIQPALAEGLAREREAYRSLIPTRDREEGIDAFNAKRKPQFTGS
jgi:enoyl-CoA hydratase/carnithine racemase